MAETGLPEARLTGERGRTSDQLRLFAQVVRAGDHHGVRIDPALPERTPMPRVDIRQRKIPVGPVAVFGASQLPPRLLHRRRRHGLGTGRRLPGGLQGPQRPPGHQRNRRPGHHPGRHGCEPAPGHLLARSTDPAHSIGQALVADPRIKAVGFTGSPFRRHRADGYRGGPPGADPGLRRNELDQPGLLLRRGTGRGRRTRHAKAYARLGHRFQRPAVHRPGPGLRPGRGIRRRLRRRAVAPRPSTPAGQTMLTEGIADSWVQGVHNLGAQPGRRASWAAAPRAQAKTPRPRPSSAPVSSSSLDNPVLHEEIFGAASLVIRYERRRRPCDRTVQRSRASSPRPCS